MDLNSLFNGFGFGLGFNISNGYGLGFGFDFPWIWMWTWIWILFLIDLDLDLVSIFQMKICFDSSWNVPTSQISYSCNCCIYHLKTKIILIPHTMYLQSLHWSHQNKISFNSSQNVLLCSVYHIFHKRNENEFSTWVKVFSWCEVLITVFTRETKMTSPHDSL